jgi:hypothetical protein
MPSSCARHSAHDRHHHLDGARRRHLAPLDEAAQALSLEILEHHVGDALVLVDLVDDDDVLVMARRGGARLAQKAVDELARLGHEELDGHAPPELGVAREVDDAHAAAAELADDLVLANARASGELVAWSRGLDATAPLGVGSLRLVGHGIRRTQF